MQKQNMIFIFFIAFLSIIFLGYVFVVGNDGISKKKLGVCEFEKQYILLMSTESEKEGDLFITLREDGLDEVKTVRVKMETMPSLNVGNYYTFKFKTKKSLHDEIDQVFEVGELEEVKDNGLNATGTNGICQSHLLLK